MGKTTTSFPCIPHQNLGAACYVEAVESKEIVTCGRLYIFGWCRVNCRLQIRKVIYRLIGRSSDRHAGIESEELLINKLAPSGWGLFEHRQLVLSERRVFKWRTAEVPSDDGSLGLKYVNMWDWYLFP